MQGADFVNDLCNNYLAVFYRGEENDFALRMLMENAAKGFLPIELRRLDGQTYLYYNISGMQSMEIIYAEKLIEREAFQNIMWQLHDAIEQSRELFLPGDGICLEPALIFWNLGMQRWEFVYVPQDSEKETAKIQKEREEFAEFLVMKIDYEDKKLTEAVYRFYEEICAGRMSPEFFGENERADEKWEKWPENETSAEMMEKKDAVTDVWEIDEPEEITEECEHTVAKKETGKRWKRALFMVWCVSVAITFLWGRVMREIILPGGAITALLTAYYFL